jgi:ribosomal protein S18 acetylase RimI-like enzyme
VDDWRRAIDFIRAVDERAAEQVVPFRWGRAFVNRKFRFVHDLNYLVADRLDGATAGLLIAEAERIQGDAVLSHRRVNVDDQPAAGRMSADFVAQGFLAERFVIMAYRGHAETGVGLEGTEEVDWSVLRPARELELRRQPWARRPELVQQILAKHQLTARSTNTRYFAMMVGGSAVSSCELRSDGRTAQIETVETLDEFRNRGYARAVIATALAAARAHDFVFLVADATDWPKQLYRRLGFEDIGHESRFLRIDA